jgi:signal transduction histidine kinase
VRPASIEGPTLKLLIVDDDEGDRKLIRRCVERSGLCCEYTEADTVAEALKLASAERFDCVLLDYYLPGEDGLHGLSVLAANDEFMPIIMFTGRGSERIASEAIKLGAMDYINKGEMSIGIMRSAIDRAVKTAQLNRRMSEQKTALQIFARVLVHDMKAPTQSILGFSKLIETFILKGDFDPAKIVKQSQRLAEAALRMNAMLDTLHAYTEADTHPQKEDVELDKLVGDVTINLDKLIEKSGARVICTDLPTVHGDPTQLTQLLQNLIANGVKYCKAAIPEVSVAAEQLPDGGWRIEVRDNGIGIPEKDWTAIFEPFKRLHSQGEYDGTGLGLATCKKIAELHGGAIWCRSELGKGTSFFVTLAPADADADTEAQAQPPKNASRSCG